MFFFYKILTYLLYPFLILLIYLRRFLNKEDKERFKEKIFFHDEPQIKKKLIWFHGASIGEINSIIPIIKYFLKDKDFKILITSVTLSSVKILSDEFKYEKNVSHKFFPMDVTFLMKDFINKYNPSSVIFVDSEIWPNCISEIKKKNIPIVLLNARITDKTLKRWLLIKKFAKQIFSSFDICIASSKNSQENLKKLGVKDTIYFGNLKFVNNLKKLDKLNENIVKSFNERKIWLAASTHPNEEIICVETHKLLKKKIPNLLTLIAPRHINRINEIISKIKKTNIKLQVIDDNDNSINENTEIVLINSFGSLNKYYQYCKNIFMGKSLNKKLILVGGQNPLEAARLGCKIYHGPFTYNFKEIYEYLETLGISELIKNHEDLCDKIMNDMNSNFKVDDVKVNKINKFGQDIFDNTVKKLEQTINL